MLHRTLLFLATWVAVACATMTCAFATSVGAHAWRAINLREPAACAWHKTQSFVRTLVMLGVMSCSLAGVVPCELFDLHVRSTAFDVSSNNITQIYSNTVSPQPPTRRWPSTPRLSASEVANCSGPLSVPRLLAQNSVTTKELDKLDLL